MWHKPWTLRKGLVLGAGLIVIGLILNLSIGPVDWSFFIWPTNLIVLLTLVTFILILYFTARHFEALRFLSTLQAAIPALAYAVVLTIVMGLTRQNGEGSGIHNMLCWWPFVLIYVYMAVILGLVVLKKIPHSFGVHELSTWWTQQGVAWLFHLGLFVVLVTATLGNSDMQRLRIIAVEGQKEWRAVDERNCVKEMPLAIELKHFIMEEYADGMPKRYASEVMIYTHSGKAVHAIVDVNKPIRVEGWKIYQFSYDTQAGAASQMSIFELVHDPWLPYVYIGIALMLLAALLSLVVSKEKKEVSREKKDWKRMVMKVMGMLLLIVICWKGFSLPDKLPPALQSPWFIPHIAVYILAYSTMAAATIMAIWTLVRKPAEDALAQRYRRLDTLVRIGIAFITFGMLFGALWAKEAWGHYWTWDPKETWSAITWLAYLCYVHYRRMPHHRTNIALWLLIVSFALLQMCWWGINFLPSAVETSVHTYN